jgi:enoyl-CoA hydratase
MNRPKALNAMTESLHGQLSEIFRVVADDNADVVILTGAGRAFSAGGDVEWIRTQPSSGFEHSFREGRRIVADLLEVPQPVIAAVNGHAIGLGCTLALFCDFTYVAEKARLADPHVVLGLVPGDGASVIWPVVAGSARAKRHLLTGDPILGSEAAEIGMVTEALPAEQVLGAAEAMAERLLQLPQTALRGTKLAVNAPLRRELNGLLDVSLTAERVSRESEDHRLALEGYVAKINEERS